MAFSTAFLACPASATETSWGWVTGPGLRDRDPNRTHMAWTPARNGGFSTAPDPLLVLPPITAPGYDDYRVVNVEAQKRLSGSLFNWHRRMLTCRRVLPALRTGDCQLLDAGHPALLAYARNGGGMTVLVVAKSLLGRRFHLAGSVPLAGGADA